MFKSSRVRSLLSVVAFSGWAFGSVAHASCVVDPAEFSLEAGQTLVLKATCAGTDIPELAGVPQFAWKLQSTSALSTVADIHYDVSGSVEKHYFLRVRPEAGAVNAVERRVYELYAKTGCPDNCVLSPTPLSQATVTVTPAGVENLTVALSPDSGGNGVIHVPPVPQNPALISCVHGVVQQDKVCQAAPNHGVLLPLQALPGDGYRFSHWEGGGCAGSDDVCHVSMQGARAVTAHFVSDGTAVLSGARCGTSHGLAASVKPSANLCTLGTASNVLERATEFMWSCQQGADTVPCSAPKLTRTIAVTIQQPSHGDIKHQGVKKTQLSVYPGERVILDLVPTTNGYAATQVSACGASQNLSASFTGTYISSPITSTCTITASFDESKNGACGTRNGTTVTSDLTATSTGLCGGVANPTSTLVNGSFQGPSSGQYAWQCGGIGTGEAVACSATRNYIVTATANNTAVGPDTLKHGSIAPSSRQVAFNGSATFSINANGNTPVVTGCNGSLSGNTYTVNNVSSDCTVTATFTPPSADFIGRGFWLPNPLDSSKIVGDRSAGASSIYVPGCLNFGSGGAETGCGANGRLPGNAEPNNTQVVAAMVYGKTIIVRLKSKATIPTEGLQAIQFTGGNGANVPFNFSAWLSTSPTAGYDQVASGCRLAHNVANNVTPTPYLFFSGGPSNCAVERDSLYYLHMRIDDTSVADTQTAPNNRTGYLGSSRYIIRTNDAYNIFESGPLN